VIRQHPSTHCTLTPVGDPLGVEIKVINSYLHSVAAKYRCRWMQWVHLEGDTSDDPWMYSPDGRVPESRFAAPWRQQPRPDRWL